MTTKLTDTDLNCFGDKLANLLHNRLNLVCIRKNINSKTFRTTAPCKQKAPYISERTDKWKGAHCSKGRLLQRKSERKFALRKLNEMKATKTVATLEYFRNYNVPTTSTTFTI